MAYELTDPLRRAARLALSEACRDAAEFTRALMYTGTDVHAQPGEFIRASRQARNAALEILYYSVFVELSRGASWQEVAAAAGLTEQEMRSRYEDAWHRWCSGDRRPPEPKPEGWSAARPATETAADLDEWYRRTGGPETPSDAVSAGLFT